MIKNVLAMLVLAVLAACAGAPPAEEHTEPTAASSHDSDVVELLFVQDARSVEFGDGVLTMRGVKPTTLYFSDRPHRVAGVVALENFLHTMKEEGSFRESHPNATLVTLEGETLHDIVMELSGPPTLEGDVLTLPMRLLMGTPPESAGASALFIDAIGEPDVWQNPYADATKNEWQEPEEVSNTGQNQPEEVANVGQNQPQEVDNQFSERAFRADGTASTARTESRSLDRDWITLRHA